MGPLPLEDRDVIQAWQQLRAESGSHSPNLAQIERALPGLVQVDACSLANPYATTEVLVRLRGAGLRTLDGMVAHCPSPAPAIAEHLAPHLGIPADCLLLANGACEVIHALLASRPGPVLLSLPTFSAYYEFARGPLVAHQLDPRQNFRLDLDELEALIDRHSPATVVIVNPNNPDGGQVPHAALVDFVERVHGKVGQIIVDETFSHFTTEGAPETLAGLACDLPNLVVVSSLSKSHGVAGLRLGYAVMAPQRAKELRGSSLWSLNAFAEWFCTLLGDAGFQRAYEAVRCRYVRDSRKLFADLDTLPGAKAFPSAANFALVQLDRPAADVVAALLAQHGIYVRDCADKRGLEQGERFIRVAARNEHENRRIVDGLRAVLSQPQTSDPLSPPVREPVFA